MGSRPRGDPVLQSQAAGGGKGLEECCNLLSCSRVIDNRHRFSIALASREVSLAGQLNSAAGNDRAAMLESVLIA